MHLGFRESESDTHVLPLVLSLDKVNIVVALVFQILQHVPTTSSNLLSSFH